MTITMPYLITTGAGNQIYARVSVDAMSSVSVSAGEQNVIIYLKYSTLEAIEVEPTLLIDTDAVSLMVGSETAGSQTASATLVGADEYSTPTWESSDKTIAAVADGVITAVGEGTCTITVTATDGTNTLTKTISVTIAAEGSSAIAVETPVVTSGTASATLDGEVLLTTGGSDTVTIGTDEITVNAISSDDTVDTVSVTLISETVVVLAAKWQGHSCSD